jgi:hypothetical protein
MRADTSYRKLVENTDYRLGKDLIQGVIDGMNMKAAYHMSKRAIKNSLG